MKFTVSFHNDNYGLRLPCPDGLRAYDAARAKSGCPDLDPDLVIVSVPTQNPIYELGAFQLDASEARRSGHFLDRTHVSVRVSDSVATEVLCERICYVHRSSTDGSVVRVTFPSVIRDGVIEAWLAAGAPLEWGVTLASLGCP